MSDDILGPTHDELDRIWGELKGMPEITYGTVTQASPLLVHLDGDVDTTGAPVSAPAQSLGALTNGQRVVCAKQHRRIIVIHS